MYQDDLDDEWVRVLRSTDRGSTWTQVADLGAEWERQDLQIDSNDRIYVTAMKADDNDNIGCWTWYSDDYGSSWQGPYNLTPLPPVEEGGDIDGWSMKTELDSQGILHVICKSDDRLPVHYNWNGVEGEGPHQIHTKEFSFFSHVPTFTLDGDEIFAFWFDQAPHDESDVHKVWYSHSPDRGVTWDVNHALEEEALWNDWGLVEGDQGSPACLFYSDLVCYIMSASDTDLKDPTGIYAYISDDGGSTWIDSHLDSDLDSEWLQPAVATYFTSQQACTYFLLA